jgi:hypothetical protein
MATFSDNFNRSNGALGSNWATVSGFSAPAIISNQVNASAVATCVAAIATGAATFAADHTATIDAAAIGDFDFLGPAVRLSAAGGTGYALKVDGRSNSNCTLVKLSGGGSSNIGGTYVITAGDVLALEVSGTSTTTLKYYKNGTLVDTVTDSSSPYTSGQPGILVVFGNVNAGRIDNFSAFDAAAPSVARGLLHNAPGLTGLTRNRLVGV